MRDTHHYVTNNYDDILLYTYEETNTKYYTMPLNVHTSVRESLSDIVMIYTCKMILLDCVYWLFTSRLCPFSLVIIYHTLMCFTFVQLTPISLKLSFQHLPALAWVLKNCTLGQQK